MLKKLLILILVLRMAMPTWADEQVVKSLFDNDEAKQKQVVVPARPQEAPPVLTPVPEVPPVPQVPKEITLELYEQAMSAAEPEFANYKDATHILGLGLDEVNHGFGTIVAIANQQGCSYGVTCAHAVQDLQPKDVLTLDHQPAGTLVAKDIKHDLAIVEFSKDLGMGVELSLDEVKPGDKLVSYGSAGFLPGVPFDRATLDKMTEIETTVQYVEEDAIFTNDKELHGRSGAGLYRDGKLVGIFQGIVPSDNRGQGQGTFNGKSWPKKYWGLAIYGRAAQILPLLTPVSYNITFYGAKAPDCQTCPQASRIVEVDEKNFAAETAKGLVMLDFWATWCQPCKAMEPVIRKLEYVKIAHINLDKCPNLAAKFNVGSIPRFILMKDGVVVDGSLIGIQTQKTLQDLIDKFDTARKQFQMFSSNDKRITVSWMDSPVPESVAKKLQPGYQLPIGIWSISNDHYSWPQNPGIYTVDQFVDMCEQSKAIPMKATVDPTPLRMGGRWARNQPQQPVGSVQCAEHIDRLFGWFDDYLKNHATGKALLHRSGARTFNVYGGKATDIKLETLLGKTGGLELSVVYPNDTPEEMKLPVRELKFGFMFDEDDVIFTIDSVRVVGLVKLVDGKIAALNMKGEQAQGFIGVLTLLSILSWIHTIYVVLHPIADVELGGEIAVSAQRPDDDQVIINFEKGKQPFVKIRSLMTFNLGINQVVINRAAKTIVAKFDGTIFAKQYTLHYK